MPIEITMPRLSDTMEEGTLIKWRVKVGDKVSSGDVLADVETDKATMELQTFDDGTVAQLAVEEGQTLAVGKLILILAGEGEKVDAVSAGSSRTTGASTTTPVKAPGSAGGSTAPKPQHSSATATLERPRVSPLARKIAEEKGLDLTRIQGTGPGGRIIKRDLTAPGSIAASGNASTSAPSPSAPLPKLESKTTAVSNMRKTIAKRLVESKTTIPHFTVTLSVDMDALLTARESLNDLYEATRGKLSVTDLLLRGVAVALTRHPLINAAWTDAGITQFGQVHIGLAVSLPAERGGGLVVPVLRDVTSKSLWQIAADAKQLANKARTTGLSIQEMSDGTFTVSNLGMYGIDHFEAIINPPQAAILAVGATLEKPVVRQGKITVGKEMTLTLSADHRVIDGAMAAEFLQTLKKVLENPITLTA
ncbi:MAG: 2-oxo acid dehydrogenase subunit E2 [Phycisphaeraceae bacterium]|nr:2-oxo acid dehydrogenase subunit E2 [Phycisphaeraceae bacterium]